MNTKNKFRIQWRTFMMIVVVMVLGVVALLQNTSTQAPTSHPKAGSQVEPTSVPIQFPEKSARGHKSKITGKRPLDIVFRGPDTIKARDEVTYILSAECTTKFVDQVELRIFEVYYNEQDAGGPYISEKLYPPRNFEILDPIKLSRDTFKSGDIEQIKFRVRWKKTVTNMDLIIGAWGRIKQDDGTMSFREGDGLGHDGMTINYSENDLPK